MTTQRFTSDPYWKYDVFLSFRGEDTRKNFTDHLYAALVQRGILVFKDDKELEKGSFIAPAVLKAIEESRFSIIVLSKGFASSSWCLEEVMKIVECMNTRGQKVIPVFYNVDPSTVRKPAGSFEEAFFKHEKDNKNIEMIQKWKSALVEVANLSGWDVKDRHEYDLIQEIVKEISRQSSTVTCTDLKGLVGIDSRLEKLLMLMGIGLDGVRMIGIYGMGGSGKTTIAKVVYKLFSHKFDGSSFLENVREVSKKSDGLLSLQKQLLSQIQRGKEFNILDTIEGTNEVEKRLRHRKVLVVIDNVTQLHQLEKLAGNRNWFGSGSRVLISTRDERLLKLYRVDEAYEAQLLNNSEARQLFDMKAFDHGPLEEYEKFSKYFVKYANGLPLALQVLGSFLFGRPVEEWKSTKERLKSDSSKEILDILRISFDALEDKEKEIFLDIVCFFNGHHKNYITRILDGCGFNSTIGISLLIEKSLLIIENNKLWVHDLLQEMGRQIIRNECPKEPGKRSRIWNEVDVRRILTNNTGTELIEGIVVEGNLHLSVSAKAFSNMKNLRLLKISGVQLPEGLEYLPTGLRLLEWRGYPLKSLPSIFQLKNIVELDMSNSCIKKLWEGIQHFSELKSITLKQCQNLTETPDFTGVPNLEKLILEGCSMLGKIHPSLLVHKKITFLKLRNCTSLTTFPSKIHMESLHILDISGCSKLESEEEERLEELDIRGTFHG